MNFKDKVFLITGSTSGIGQGIAKALLEQGAYNLLIGLTEKEKIYFILFSNLLLEMYSILYLIKHKNSRDKKCVDIHDRITPLDFWVCILAFTFDLNFDISYKIVKENDYINMLIDRFEYKDKNRMQKVRKIVNEFIGKKINN